MSFLVEMCLEKNRVEETEKMREAVVFFFFLLEGKELNSHEQRP